MKKSILFIAAFVISRCAVAQAYFSVATDASILRSFTPQQKFLSFGQTVQANAHITKKESAYVWVSYYTNGKYRNNQTAFARVPVLPLFINYKTQSRIRYRQVSLGWKHYWKGSFDNEQSWNLYSTAGFGLLLGKVDNTYSQPIDTARYTVPQQALAGSGSFRRLTFDLGAGGELLLGGGVYLYGELRTWLPASDYPSPYLYNNDVPRVLLLNGGIRILLY